MKIAVCIKQVPVVSLLKFDNETRRVVRDGVPSEVNPIRCAWDVACHQPEAGARCGGGGLYNGAAAGTGCAGTVPAMGADSAVHLNDRAFAGSDTLATARALAPCAGTGRVRPYHLRTQQC